MKPTRTMLFIAMILFCGLGFTNTPPAHAEDSTVPYIYYLANTISGIVIERADNYRYRARPMPSSAISTR